MSEIPKFGLNEAIEYYEEESLQGPQAMMIDGMPEEVLGLTRNDQGRIVLYVHSSEREWEVVSTGEFSTQASPDVIAIDEHGPQMIIRNRGQ